ncbi:hypothetical protein D3C75_1035300 [compost metagenome]
MAAVEHPQFHLLERQNIVHQLHTGILPAWAASNKIIFHHPLNEGFTGDSAFITHATQGCSNFIQRFWRSGRNDAIDHGAGEGDMLSDPLG